MIKYKFLHKKDEEFSSTLRSRVNKYFQENKLNRDANTLMVVKSIALFTWYLAPFFIIIFGDSVSPPFLFTGAREVTGYAFCPDRAASICERV